jgi:hypothetical protein
LSGHLENGQRVYFTEETAQEQALPPPPPTHNCHCILSCVEVTHLLQTFIIRFRPSTPGLLKESGNVVLVMAILMLWEGSTQFIPTTKSATFYQCFSMSSVDQIHLMTTSEQ